MKKPAGPAGFSDTLPPTCQRASRCGSIRGCPCKGRVLGYTEASPNNPGAEGQDPWLSQCECSRFPWLLLTPSIAGCRLLENQPASPFHASGCFLSRQLWAIAGGFCRFLFGLAKLCFLATGAEDGAWRSVLPAGLSRGSAGPWVAPPPARRMRGLRRWQRRPAEGRQSTVLAVSLRQKRELSGCHFVEFRPDPCFH